MCWKSFWKVHLSNAWTSIPRCSIQCLHFFDSCHLKLICINRHLMCIYFTKVPLNRERNICHIFSAIPTSLDQLCVGFLYTILALCCPCLLGQATNIVKVTTSQPFRMCTLNLCKCTFAVKKRTRTQIAKYFFSE